MLVGECVEAALVFSLVLGDAGVAGYQRVDRLGGRTDARAELVGFDMKVGGVQFGSYGLVDQLVDLVPAGEEVVDGVEERGGDLFIADMRGRTRGSTCVFVVALPDAFFVFGAGMPGFRPVPDPALGAPDFAGEGGVC